MELLERVKVANRVRTNDPGIVGELEDLIASAKADMKSRGILEKEDDSLYRQAIVLYTKGHFGFDNPDADRFIGAYNDVADHMASSTLYTKED